VSSLMYLALLFLFLLKPQTSLKPRIKDPFQFSGEYSNPHIPVVRYLEIYLTGVSGMSHGGKLMLI